MWDYQEQCRLTTSVLVSVSFVELDAATAIFSLSRSATMTCNQSREQCKREADPIRFCYGSRLYRYGVNRVFVYYRGFNRQVECAVSVLKCYSALNCQPYSFTGKSNSSQVNIQPDHETIRSLIIEELCSL